MDPEGVDKGQSAMSNTISDESIKAPTKVLDYADQKICQEESLQTVQSIANESQFNQKINQDIQKMNRGLVNVKSMQFDLKNSVQNITVQSNPKILETPDDRSPRKIVSLPKQHYKQRPSTSKKA